MSAAHVSGALARLASMAATGSPPLVLLVQELQRWCAVAAGHQALRRDHLNQAGRPRDADDAVRWAQALARAQRALRVYA